MSQVTQAKYTDVEATLSAFLSLQIRMEAPRPRHEFHGVVTKSPYAGVKGTFDRVRGLYTLLYFSLMCHVKVSNG